MYFTRSQHKSIKGNTWKKLDPPGSGTPGRRQAGPGCQSRPGGVKASRGLDSPRARPVRARNAGRARNDVAAADKGGTARGANGVEAHAHGRGAHPQHRQAERGGERRRDEEWRRRMGVRVAERLRAGREAAEGQNRVRRRRGWFVSVESNGDSPAAVDCGSRQSGERKRLGFGRGRKNGRV
jgi:hypothetical protein